VALLHPGDRHVVERELAREIVVHVLDQALRGHRCANSEYLNPRHLVPTAEDYVLQLLEQDRPVVDGGVPRGGLAQQRVALELALLLRVLVLVHLSLVLVILPVVVVVLLPPLLHLLFLHLLHLLLLRLGTRLFVHLRCRPRVRPQVRVL